MSENINTVESRTATWGPILYLLFAKDIFEVKSKGIVVSFTDESTHGRIIN